MKGSGRGAAAAAQTCRPEGREVKGGARRRCEGGARAARAGEARWGGRVRRARAELKSRKITRAGQSSQGAGVERGSRAAREG